MEESLKGMFERKGTLILQDHDDDDTELMKRLRAWKDANKAANEQ